MSTGAKNIIEVHIIQVTFVQLPVFLDMGCILHVKERFTFLGANQPMDHATNTLGSVQADDRRVGSALRSTWDAIQWMMWYQSLFLTKDIIRTIIQANTLSSHIVISSRIMYSILSFHFFGLGLEVDRARPYPYLSLVQKIFRLRFNLF